MCIRVNRWKHIATVALLTLWAACSINCAFDNVSPVSCCPEETNSQPIDGCCVCTVLVSGAYVSHSQPWSAALAADTPAASTQFVDIALPDPPSWRAGIDASPPELAGTWQFVVRTALPPRAPSFVS